MPGRDLMDTCSGIISQLDQLNKRLLNRVTPLKDNYNNDEILNIIKQIQKDLYNTDIIPGSAGNTRPQYFIGKHEYPQPNDKHASCRISTTENGEIYFAPRNGKRATVNNFKWEQYDKDVREYFNKNNKLINEDKKGYKIYINSLTYNELYDIIKIFDGRYPIEYINNK